MFIGGLAGGGSERVLANLANNLSGKHSVYVVTGVPVDNEYMLNDSVKRYPILKYRILADCHAVRCLVKKQNMDTVIGMGIYANFIIGIINFNLKTKMIISERNDPRHDHISFKSRILRFLVYRRADFFVFQTHEEKEFYSKKIQNRGVVIHNVLKENLPMKKATAGKRFVAVGRLMPQKNYPMMLRAFEIVNKKIPDCTLEIYGVGTEYEKLMELTRQLKIDKAVTFKGFCNDVHDQVKEADIFLMSSDFEGMPNALMEAMAMGFCTISTDCPAGGSAEIVTDGINGILVPVGDYNYMAEKIIDVLNDKNKRILIEENAIKIRNTHSTDVIIKQWEDIL